MTNKMPDGPQPTPRWDDDLVAAGRVAPVAPEVLARARQAVRQAAADVSSDRGPVANRPRRRLRARLAGAGLVAAAAALVLTQTPTTDDPAVGAAEETPASTTRGASAQCVESYSLSNLTHRHFALDGTVAAIGGKVSGSGPGQPGVSPDVVAVTFDVHSWYRGGSGSRVTISMGLSGRTPDSSLRYDIGTRLLVSGNIDAREPKSKMIAWMACGFTRPYDTATATAWRSALKK
ncbi:hypothetical protein GCM10009804_23130 [Kribbella hippodromi]|uniref:Uncharacterized protein n=1 Tax=Kribbella hippodromi TaxID=434347 RepID=A0ABN2CYR0_9ACTN